MKKEKTTEQLTDDNGVLITACMLLAIASSGNKEDNRILADGISQLDINTLMKYFEQGKVIKKSLVEWSLHKLKDEKQD